MLKINFKNAITIIHDILRPKSYFQKVMLAHCHTAFRPTLSAITKATRLSSKCPLDARVRTHLFTHSFSSTAVANVYTAPCKACVTDSGTSIVVDFVQNDGSIFSSLYHAPWLWSNTPCNIMPSSGQKLKSPGEWTTGSKISAVDIVSINNCDESLSTKDVMKFPHPPKGCSHPVGTVYKNSCRATGAAIEPQPLLQVTWESSLDGKRHPGVSYYDLRWLRQWSYDTEALNQRRESSEVTRAHAIRKITKEDDGLVTMDFTSLTSKDRQAEMRLEFLHALVRDGAAVVRNAPPVSSGPSASVAVIGRTLGGYLSHGALYGDTFHVKSIPNAHNIAYTPSPLPPHQDLLYYESIPGFQLLHCLSNASTEGGGESVLIDAMAAAHELRRISPKHFRTLVQCPATFVKQREGADLIYLRPHIVLREGADDSLDREILAVNWSPPFEGPLCAPTELVEDYYEAYAAFEQMLNNALPSRQNCEKFPQNDLTSKLREFAEEHTWERSLKPGEILVFNNHRMLHGRRGLSKDADRHLVGCYTNVDDTLNQYRVLRRNHDNPESFSVRNVGNGTSGIE